ncbi:hypothetical protein DXG01_015940 [Tephrocybe rancida]|nr:hypothetical protein DXG01_015940 [Tephrocybe rancida]
MREVMLGVLVSPAMSSFTVHPFEAFWHPSPNSEPERIFTETFTANRFINEHKKVQQLPQVDSIENVVFRICLWSDSTHLTNFSKPSLWPIYFYSANQWKNIRAKPTSFSENHLTYIPKYLAKHPCPRCFIRMDKISQLGGKLDRRRRQTQMRVDNMRQRQRVENNAFSVRLDPHGFDFYSMIISDVLHEFEIGMFLAVFKHCIWILYAAGNDSIQELNRQFHHIPTFGCDTIRKFSNDTAAMKKLAACDYEDILQCAIPTFEGLLPEPHNTILIKLLFELATWHGLAKLKMHTDSTLQDLDSSLTRLGNDLRHFKKVTCANYVTRELPGEVAARGRRSAALAAARKVPTSKPAQGRIESTKETAPKKKSRVRTFNLSTVKLHGMGDYPDTIRDHGMTDNYSTQVGELAHRRVKHIFPVIQKSSYTLSIAKYEQRQRILRRMHENAPKAATKGKRKHQKDIETPWLQFEDEENLPVGSPDQHHVIAHDVRHGLHLSSWLGDSDDPALEGFQDKLRDHCLARLLNEDHDGDVLWYTPTQRRQVLFVGNKIYCHKAQDSLNPRTHANVMVLSREDDDDDGHPPFPYWFCCIIGIFHAMVQHVGPDSTSQDPQLIEFLWARWYGRIPGSRGGWKARRLHQVGFVDGDDDAAFGFLDPARVVCGVHLIPSFVDGRTRDLLPPSDSARAPEEKDEDYQLFNVAMFVDRDMIMRFQGIGQTYSSGHREAPETDKEGQEVEVEDNQEGEENLEKPDSSEDEDEEEDYRYKDPMDQIVRDDGDEEWVDDNETSDVPGSAQSLNLAGPSRS